MAKPHVYDWDNRKMQLFAYSTGKRRFDQDKDCGIIPEVYQMMNSFG